MAYRWEMTPDRAKIIAFAAAQLSQVVFGIGIIDAIRTIEHSLPHDVDRAGWDLSMWILHASGTHRVGLYGAGTLLLLIQLKVFLSASRASAALGWMFVAVVGLLMLFANGLFVVLRLNGYHLLAGH